MAPSRWLSEPEMRVWRGFLAASANVTQQIDGALKSDASLTLDDYEVLVHLSEEPERRLRMADLSARLIQSRSRLTQRIDRMEARGLVMREKCEADARGTWAVLTDHGFATIAAAAPDHVIAVRRFLLDHIPDDQLENFGELLAGLASAPPD